MEPNTSDGTAVPKVLEFGGPWSLIKTEMVEQYVRFFNTALKDKPFGRVYIDAFAGTGAFTCADNLDARTLFGNEKPAVHRGSAAVALEVGPPFHKILFIERTKDNADSLNTLIAQSRELWPNLGDGRGQAAAA